MTLKFFRISFCIWFFATVGLVERSAAQAVGRQPAQSDIEYATVDGRSLKLHLYAPSTERSTSALLVWVHGGAWRSGSKEDVAVTALLDDGFYIASVDYRLSPVAKFPAQIFDIKSAIRFLRANAQTYGYDPNKFVIAGSSAGGHLAALVGVSNGIAELEGNVGKFTDTSSDVQAIVSFYGASNLQSILSQSTQHGLSVRVPALNLLLGDAPQTRPSLERLASPLAHVDASDPPLWLIHGDSDPQMPIKQSREFCDAYKALGLSVNFETIAGAKHGGDVFYEPERLHRLAMEITSALNAN